MFLPRGGSSFLVTGLIADRFLAIHFYLGCQELVTYKRVTAVNQMSVQWNSFLFSAIFGILDFTLEITAIFSNWKTYNYSKTRWQINQIHAMELNIQSAARNGESCFAQWQQFTSVLRFWFVVCQTYAFYGLTQSLRSEPLNVLIKQLDASINPLFTTVR